MRDIVAVAHVVHADAFVGIGGMDELARTGVDADMGNAVFVGVLEKHQVARLKLAVRNGSAVVVLLGRGAWQSHAAGRAEDIAHKAGAVKPGARRAAHHIARAAKGIGGLHDIAAVEGLVLRLNFGDLGLMLRGRGRAGMGEGCGNGNQRGNGTGRECSRCAVKSQSKQKQKFLSGSSSDRRPSILRGSVGKDCSQRSGSPEKNRKTGENTSDKRSAYSCNISQPELL